MRNLKMNRWHSSIASLAVLAVAAGVESLSTSLPATAQTPAAASIVGQCRATKQSTAIFAQRSATSAVIAPLAANQRVTLSENGGTDGYIGVSSPGTGFVQTVNLKPCTTGVNPTPPPDKGVCRRVSQPQGLIIRQQPSTTSAIMGGADFNSQIFLTTTPATSKTSPDGRIWVQVGRPLAGWVANGFTNSAGSNLVFCQ